MNPTVSKLSQLPHYAIPEYLNSSSHKSDDKDKLQGIQHQVSEA
jgi:hypothetical protein